MSYNYDQCVQSIQEHRRRAYADAANAAAAAPDLEALQQSIDGFAGLSKHCPMTPLLWMQYARDTEALLEGLMGLESPSAEGAAEDQLQMMQARKSALETSTGILELALAEFPGCALLHLYYLESLADMLYQSEGMRQINGQNGAIDVDADGRGAVIDKLNAAFEAAWQAVGRGTHVNEGAIVSEIYRLHGSFLLFCLSSMVKADGAGTKPEPNAILQLLTSLFQKWSKTPMGEGANDEMMQDLEYYWDEACSILLSLCVGEQAKHIEKERLEQQKANLWAAIDEERKKTSSLANILSSHEDDVDVAMSNEGISLPRHFLLMQQDEKTDGSNGSTIGSHTQPLKRICSKWNQILLVDTHRFLLGLGGSETSRAFMKTTSSMQRTYADVSKKRNSAALTILEDHIATHKYPMICSLHERSVSECPTVEALWVSYMNFLSGEYARARKDPEGQEQQKEISSALQSVSQRAIRNCPYSSTLFEAQMNALGLTSVSNLEPDDISAIVQEATQLGFLTNNREAMLALRLVAISVVKRRLLSLVSSGTAGMDYDQSESMGSHSTSNHKQKSTNGTVVYQPLNPAAAEEVHDLLEDMRDMYDETDNYLFKSHSTWAEGKVSFWKHRALAEAYVLSPIGSALKQDSDDMVDESDAVADKEALRCFEKLVKAQKPSHPDSWREYIRYVSASQNSSKVAAVAASLRKTRGLYHRAMSSVKKAGQELQGPVPAENKQAWMGRGGDCALAHRDHDIALTDLCREYMEFERSSGSEESLTHAQTLVRSKLANWSAPTTIAAATTPVANGELHGKRKHEDGFTPANEHTAMAGDEEEHDAQIKRAKVKTDLKQPKKTDGVHKVRIGKMKYPAHPFTIHVSNLSKDTQDMDLVDAFRAEVGPVVHAKILRQKNFGKGGHHFHGESKGSGLVQFEERLSVEKALQKDGELEVGGKMIKIQRSHLPAVGLVPAGMHRVNPKGEGKVSKRNKIKKGAKMKVDTKEKMDVEEDGKQTDGGDKKSPAAMTSPSSISLSVLSLKPRGMRQKPKIDLKKK